MGEVWRGEHTEQGTPVAIKVLTREGVQRRAFLSAFRNEVRAVAGLTHPYVVLVFDYGELPAELARATEGRLVAGSPYLVMELVDGGTLVPWCGRLSWAEVREILLGLFDALSHAHARGVIHRDIKPGNVLLPSARTRPGIRLADFGLAQINEGLWQPQHGLSGGTPFYMSPEQFHNRADQVGPWTDLYSIGRLALALVWGHPAPAAEDVLAGTPVPEGFNAWLARLLMQEPEERFRRAADAAAALMDLGPAPEGLGPAERAGGPLPLASETFVLPSWRSETPSQPGNSAERPLPMPEAPPPAPPEPRPPAGGLPRGIAGANTSLWGDLELPSLVFEEGEPAPAPEDERSAYLRAAPVERRVPPMPSSGRQVEPPDPPPQLLGVGLGLYNLRTIPMVDRDFERDALWTSLREAREQARPRLAAITGPSGCGLSRLAQWLCERAHEVGAASIVRVHHAPTPGPSDGLAPALARFLHVNGRPRPEVLARVSGALGGRLGVDPQAASAITELLCPAPEGEPGALRFSSPVERYAAARALLMRLASERPIVLCLDDAHWDPDSLAFAAYLLGVEEEAPCPVLLLVVACTEELARLPAAAAALTDLLRREDALGLELGPLGPGDRAALVRRLLGLEGDVAAQVEDRCGGNPQFAVQLVGDWVQRGLLVPGQLGFRLAEGAQVELPERLNTLWTGRVEQLLAQDPGCGWAPGLELAAVLGQDISGLEWARACADAGLEAPWDAVEQLLQQRLARADARGPQEAWSWVHNLLRESLERRAREQGRLEAHHRACARMLAQSGWSDPLVSERLGRHLAAAGEREAALPHLAQAARARLRTGDYGHAEVLLAEWSRALEGLELPESDPRRGEGLLLHTELARLRGRLDEARERAERLVAVSRAQGWRALLARALHELARVSWHQGQPERGIALFEEAVEVARAEGDGATVARALVDLASMQVRVRRQDAGRAAFERALAELATQDEPIHLGYALWGLGDLLTRRQEHSQAQEHLERAVGCFERAGFRRGVADCLNSLGLVAREQGDADRAEALFRRSRDTLQAIGSAMVLIPACNLGLVLLDRERWGEAELALEPALKTLQRQSRRTFQGIIHTYLLPGSVAGSRWPEYDHHLKVAAELLRETGELDVDAARAAERAADLACKAGHLGRAWTAYQLAMRQWEGLGRREDLERVQSKVEGIDTLIGL